MRVKKSSPSTTELGSGSDGMATIGIVAAEGMSMMKRPPPAYGSGERQQHDTLGSVDVREGFPTDMTFDVWSAYR
jgi:hypothetical protein